MTWSVTVLKADGSKVGTGDACNECKRAEVCQVRKAKWAAANVLTAVDVCNDGHMASGQMNLNCYGFDQK